MIIYLDDKDTFLLRQQSEQKALSLFEFNRHGYLAAGTHFGQVIIWKKIKMLYQLPDL